MSYPLRYYNFRLQIQTDFHSDFSYWLEKNGQNLRNLFVIVHDGIFSKWIINNLASLKQR